MSDAEWVRRSELPQRYPIPLGTWNRWAYRGEGPPYARVGKHALYRIADVEKMVGRPPGRKVIRTAIEIAIDGTPLQLFHRQDGSAWDHPTDDPTLLTTGRHSAIVTRPCPVCARRSGKVDGRAPGPRRAAGADPREAAP